MHANPTYRVLTHSPINHKKRRFWQVPEIDFRYKAGKALVDFKFDALYR